MSMNAMLGDSVATVTITDTDSKILQLFLSLYPAIKKFLQQCVSQKSIAFNEITFLS